MGDMTGNALMVIRRHTFVICLDAGLRRCGVEPGDRLVLAVSGGADSTALVLGAAALATLDKWRLDLHVAHVHHHLRDDADGDAAFVQRLAAEWSLPFHRRDVHPRGKAGNLEAVARRMRYDALLNVAQRIDADAIATAHHADDQLETMLMRLMRGTSVAGLSGMAPRRKLGDRRLVRPMLRIDAVLPRHLLETVGQAWCEDDTNHAMDRTRARLREQVLPVLRSLRPDAAAKAVHAADQLRQARAVLRRLERDAADRLLIRNGEVFTIERAALRERNRIIATGVVRRACRRLGVPGDRLGRKLAGAIAAAACDASNEPRRFDLAGGVTAHVDATRLRLGPWAH